MPLPFSSIPTEQFKDKLEILYNNLLNENVDRTQLDSVFTEFNNNLNKDSKQLNDPRYNAKKNIDAFIPSVRIAGARGV